MRSRLRPCLLAALVAAGCYPVNPKLPTVDPSKGYRFENLLAPDSRYDPDNTFVALAFSGGGTRAAAFAYGVLQELAATPMGDDRSLLDEVDVVSSVSGGSFAAAYLGVFGREAFFRDFRKEVLDRPIECALILRVLAPWNWPRLLSPRFTRADLADEYYDTHIFQGRHFGDLPLQRPFIVLNATDIARGAQFSFTQDSFDRLCSDLSDVHVSRGVTASSAFPVAFPPLTFDNYPKTTCAYETPKWVTTSLGGDLEVAPERWALARTWKSYEEPGHPYVHLSDGGLADNLGVRAIEYPMAMTGTWDFYQRVMDGRVKRFVIIVVDAKPGGESCIDRCSRAPGIPTVLNAAATTPMENYSMDTVAGVREWFDEWDREASQFEVRRAGCKELADESCRGSSSPGCTARRRRACETHLNAGEAFRVPKPELYEVHVRFDAIADASVREQLQGVGTRLQLPRTQVDLLIEWARKLLRSSPEYVRLLADLHASESPQPQ